MALNFDNDIVTYVTVPFAMYLPPKYHYLEYNQQQLYTTIVWFWMKIAWQINLSVI